MYKINSPWMETLLAVALFLLSGCPKHFERDDPAAYPTVTVINSITIPLSVDVGGHKK